MSEYELRIYTPEAGKLDPLLQRFRDHTVRLFAEHGIEGVGYWVSQEDPPRLHYLLKHGDDPEAAWQAFKADEDWLRAQRDSERHGPLVRAIERVRLLPTDFSGLD